VAAALDCLVDLKDGLAVLALIWILFPLSRALSQIDDLRCADMCGEQ
jgi:hypothetical protein